MFSTILKLIAPLVKWFTSTDKTESPPPEVPESIRTRARHEGDRMADCFRRSQEAFARNEKGLAKELSVEGKAHRENMERLNKEASAKIFQGMELTSGTCMIHEVDPHIVQSIIECAVFILRETRSDSHSRHAHPIQSISMDSMSSKLNSTSRILVGRFRIAESRHFV
jgi:hypothetical protein